MLMTKVAVDNQKAYSHPSKCVLFINQQLLKNLSLKSPETFSEFETTLDFFSRHSIEIPFDFCGWDGNEHSAVMLLGGLGIQLTDGGRNGYFLENNTVKNYFSDTRYRYLLKTLSRWYKKGLIKDISLSSDLESFLSRSHGNSEGQAIVASAIGTEETAQFGKKLSSQKRRRVFGNRLQKILERGHPKRKSRLNRLERAMPKNTNSNLVYRLTLLNRLQRAVCFRRNCGRRYSEKR